MSKNLRWGWLLLVLIFGPVTLLHGQKQLIVLKGESVLLRLYPGDEITFTTKDSKKKVKKSYVNNLSDTALVAHHDVIPLHRIDKIYFVRKNYLTVIGGLLVIGGVGYFVIDQVNEVLVHGEDFNVDHNVAVSSAVMVGVGLPLMLMKKKYTRLGGKYRVIVVDKGSVFYRPDTRNSMGDY